VTVSDADIQTDEISTQETAAQTDLSGVNVNLVIAPSTPAPLLELAPPPYKSAKERQQEAAKELGIDVELVKQYLEAQKTTNRRSVDNTSSSSPVSSSSPRRVGGGGVRWRSRMLPGSVAQAPNLLVSVSTASLSACLRLLTDRSTSISTSQMLRDLMFRKSSIRASLSSSTPQQSISSVYSCVFTPISHFLLHTDTLDSQQSGAHFLPAYHHHHLAPFSVVFSSHDSTAYNAMSWEGLTPGGSGAAGLAREGLGQFLYECVLSPLLPI